MTPQETKLDCPPELRTYERQRGKIKWDDRSRYAVVNATNLIGVYRTAAEACAEVNRRQGQGRFMIKAVRSEEDYLFLGEGPVTEKDLVPVGDISYLATGEQWKVRHARELATYERLRAELERDHMGKGVLIYGDQLIGVFASPESASEEGVLRYGFEKHLAREVGDEVIFCPLGVPPDTPGAVW
jgi:hypothetical protein